MLHYLALGRGMNPLGVEGQAGDIDPTSRPDITPGGVPRPPTGGTSDPRGHLRCRGMIQRNANLSVQCRRQGRQYVPDPDPCKPGRCVDKPQRPETVHPGMRKCLDAGGTWDPDRNKCYNLPRDQPTPRDTPAPPTPPTPTRPRCPPGWSFHGGECIEHASESASDRRKREKKKRSVKDQRAREAEAARSPVPPPAQDPPYQADRARSQEILDRITQVTPASLLQEAEAAGATFDPMVEAPPPLPPPSLSDALADPRYLQAAAEQDRSLRGSASALGIRGAPVLSAAESGRRNLLGSIADQIFGQNLARGQYELQRGQDVYNRLAGNWERWFRPTQFAHDQNLRAAALALGAGDQALRAQNQGWNQWWQPVGQLRGFDHQRAMQQDALANALAMQRAGFGQQSALQRAGFDHSRAMQQAGFGQQSAMQQAGFGHDRWRIGQNNLMSILGSIFGQRAPAMAAPGW